MSATLEKLMMLQQMNSSPSVPLAMSEDQRRAAQGDAIMRIAAEMGRTGHKGRGFGRALSVMNASIDPALDAYNQAEQTAVAENAMKQKTMMEQQREAKRDAMDILKEDRAERKEQRYLDAMEGKAKTKSSGGSRKNPYYGMPQLGKLILQQQEIKEGFAPGTNREISLTPEEQEYFLGQNELAIQKLGSDSQTRQRALFAKNLVKSIDSTDIDALTQYSGIPGAAKLAKEEAKNALGKPSEDYLKYTEALTAAKLEAKELRQFLGESITPSVSEAIETLVNPTGLRMSPAAAKRKIEKSREIIKKQLDTYQKALLSAAPYRKEEHQVEQVNLEAPTQATQPKENPYANLSDEELMQLIGGE